ncbi:MAG: phytoene desaturase, partial [Balneolaceae bacterium]|nr:phytoene desaturase [Balneolaceae bacterium]
MKIAIIGAGLGGLSIACLLAHSGHDVTVFEKNDSPGGKINQIKAAGFRFDTGPSLLTLPDILKKLFNRCGESLNDYLSLEPVDPICRYFYRDGTIFNCYQDQNKTAGEIQRFAPDDVSNYHQFLEYAETLYQRTHSSFLQNPLYDITDLRSLNLGDVFKIDAFKTVAQRVDGEFESPYLRQFFKRFTTYNGSSPFRAPATLNVIPHVELSMGGYYIGGGMYNLIEALMQLAKKKEVRFYFGAEVEKIHTEDAKVTGIQVNNQTIDADLIISNSDATETYRNLLPWRDLSIIKQNKLENVEPSSSGLVLLLGIDKTYDQLSHHNIFFSGDYKQEFDAIFNRRVMPD